MKLEVNKVKAPSRDIKKSTQMMLWGVSAGICEFRGCCNRLYTHHVTGEKVNLAEKAHIYAFSKGGKRSSQLVEVERINDFGNLMLVCGSCHKLIDSLGTCYSAEDLLMMKKEHEELVSSLTSVKPNPKSEVVIYNCNIANRAIRISEATALASIIPEYYPARDVPINLSPELKLYDNEDAFWTTMPLDLERRIAEHEALIRDKHISLFAVAPQPLLFKLGALLNRNYNVSVRQSQGDISDWCWKEEKQTICLNLIEPAQSEINKKAAIIVEITAKLSDEEIATFFSNHRTYRIIASSCSPTAIKSKNDLQAVVEIYRETLNRIRHECVPGVEIALLPIAPASVSIEMGRQYMKGDPPISVYDRNYLTKEWASVLTF